MAKPDQFARIMARIGLNVEKNTTLTMRRAAIAVEQVAVLATPVDTSRARSGWYADVDVIPEDVPPIEGPFPSGQETVAAAAARINKFDIRHHEVIYLVNNVEYIQRLDDGSSSQAPEGMSAQAVQAGQEVIRRARLLKG